MKNLINNTTATLVEFIEEGLDNCNRANLISSRLGRKAVKVESSWIDYLVYVPKRGLFARAGVGMVIVFTKKSSVIVFSDVPAWAYALVIGGRKKTKDGTHLSVGAMVRAEKGAGLWQYPHVTMRETEFWSQLTS